jgi:hypothetical protein
MALIPLDAKEVYETSVFPLCTSFELKNFQTYDFLSIFSSILMVSISPELVPLKVLNPWACSLCPWNSSTRLFSSGTMSLRINQSTHSLHGSVLPLHYCYQIFNVISLELL